MTTFRAATILLLLALFTTSHVGAAKKKGGCDGSSLEGIYECKCGSETIRTELRPVRSQKLTYLSLFVFQTFPMEVVSPLLPSSRAMKVHASTVRLATQPAAT